MVGETMMKVGLKVPTLALEASGNHCLHKEKIYEEVIDDENKYDVALMNSDIRDSFCAVIKPSTE